MGIYKNVMELLVEEEVVRQFQALPPRIATYVNQVEWVAYALNQLPPLYATSETGLHRQIERGKIQHGVEIRQAVQRALAAIRRDPLRTSTPLQSPYLPFREVLSQLRFLLRNDQIEWETLPVAVEQALKRASQGKLMHPAAAPVRSPSVYAPARGSSPFPRYEVSRYEAADALDNEPANELADQSPDQSPAQSPGRPAPEPPAPEPSSHRSAPDAAASQTAKSSRTTKSSRTEKSSPSASGPSAPRLQPTPPAVLPQETFGWDDPLYNPR